MNANTSINAQQLTTIESELPMIGEKIANIRTASKQEMIEVFGEDLAEMYDHIPVVVIDFENGDKLFPSKDHEGNGPGAFFGLTKKGVHFQLA